MSESRVREGRQKNRSARPSDRISPSVPLPDWCFIVIYPRLDAKTGKPIIRPDGLLSIPRELAKAIGYLCGQRVQEGEQAEMLVKDDDGTPRVIRHLSGAIFRIPLNGKPLQQIERALRANGYRGEVYRQSGRVLFGASGPEKPRDRKAAARRYREQVSKGNLPELLSKLFGDCAKARRLIGEHSIRPEGHFGVSRLGRIDKREDEIERRALLPKPDSWPHAWDFESAQEVCPQIGAIWNLLVDTVQEEIDYACQSFLAAGMPKEERIAWAAQYRPMRYKPFLDWLRCTGILDDDDGKPMTGGAKGSETERDSLKAARTDSDHTSRAAYLPIVVSPE